MKITKKDIIELRKKFDNYTAYAEQSMFPFLALIDIRMSTTEKAINDETVDIYDTDVQKDLRAMFRVVLKTIGEDFSMYEEK